MRAVISVKALQPSEDDIKDIGSDPQSGKKLPVIFNEKNEIVNYSVKKNVFVIPRLINMVTLRLGKEKVTITKKKTSAKKAAEIEANRESADGKQ